MTSPLIENDATPDRAHTLATCEEGACEYCASYVTPPGQERDR